MHKNISPEEKLLSIIKGRRNAPEIDAPKDKVKSIESFPHAVWDKIDGYISAVLKNDFFKNSILDARILKIFNKYAVIAVALIAGYLVLDIIFVSPSRKAAALFAKVSGSGTPVVVSAEKTMPVETKSYSYYSNRMSGRNIFSGTSGIRAESQSSDMEQSAELSGGDLGLVGIVPGNNPQAIVENKKSQKTYYLVKGQSINGITVEDISEDRVALEYRGKKTTLFL
ncbi:MAG: type II secretion system protein N [Candidatus Omnitrophota bacterium]|jgi:hypothetical protein